MYHLLTDAQRDVSTFAQGPVHQSHPLMEALRGRFPRSIKSRYTCLTFFSNLRKTGFPIWSRIGAFVSPCCRNSVGPNSTIDQESVRSSYLLEENHEPILHIGSRIAKQVPPSCRSFKKPFSPLEQESVQVSHLLAESPWGRIPRPIKHR
jgi:hypothetical protein